MRCFITTAFQLFFEICHQEGPREPVGENIDTIQKNTKALLDSSKEVGLEVNPEKTK
jgi:hypothetical protein